MEMIQDAMLPMALDLALVEETTGEDAREFLVDMLPIFIEDMPQQLESLGGAVSNGDLSTAERTAHAMKASSAWIGATEFADNCRRLESAARSKEASMLEGIFQTLSRDYGRIMLWVRQQGLA